MSHSLLGRACPQGLCRSGAVLRVQAHLTARWIPPRGQVPGARATLAVCKHASVWAACVSGPWSQALVAGAWPLPGRLVGLWTRSCQGGCLGAADMQCPHTLCKGRVLAREPGFVA